MTIPDDHRTEARLNRAFAEALLRESAGDPLRMSWSVILAFYCAMHCVQAHLLVMGVEPKSHAERALWMAHPSMGVPPNIRDAYSWLKDRSESGRYRLGRFSPTFIRQRVLDDRLKTITDFVGL